MLGMRESVLMRQREGPIRITKATSRGVAREYTWVKRQEKSRREEKR